MNPQDIRFSVAPMMDWTGCATKELCVIDNSDRSDLVL
jgi:hypothetical protein